MSVENEARRGHPIRFEVEYPERKLNRLTTGFRPFMAIPIVILLAAIGGYSGDWGSPQASTAAIGGSALSFLPPLLMTVFREKYPRWWFDWNLNVMRFTNRVAVYLALMDDRYPSTDDEQSVRLDLPYPSRPGDVNRWLPLVKWLLAIPHYVALVVLYLGVLGAVVAAWLAILYSGRYPRALFDYVEGVFRWHNRVIGYAIALVTDAYPPFRLRP